MTNGTLISVLLLGLVLGLRHALDPDHVVAMSNIVGELKSVRRSSLAGTFWGFALPAIEGPNGMLGVFIASLLLMLTWVTMVVNSVWQLYLLAVVFLLQLLADYWRERTLDTIPGYFRLRATLTVGAIASIAWFLAL